MFTFPLIFLFSLVALPIIGRYRETIRDALAQLLLLFQTPFTTILEAFRSVIRWLIARIREVFVPQEEVPDALVSSGNAAVGTQPEPPKRPWPGWLVVGAVLYLAAFSVFGYAEFWLIVLTLQAMGFSTGNLQAPASADFLQGAALLAVAFFWGMILLDALKLTHIGPWEQLRKKGRYALVTLSGVCIAMTIVIAGLLGVWRITRVTNPLQTSQKAEVLSQGFGIQEPLGSHSIGTPDLDSSDVVSEFKTQEGFFDKLVTVLVGFGLPSIVGISMVFSGWGVAASFSYVWGILLCLTLAPFGILLLPLRLGEGLCNAIFGIVTAVIDFLSQIGRSFWNWICSFDGLRKSLHIRPIDEPAQILSQGGTPSTAQGTLFNSPPSQPSTQPSGQPQPQQPSGHQQPSGQPTGNPPEPEPEESWNPLGV